MADFRFVGPSYVAQSITQNDQECINWYPEVDGEEQQPSVINPQGDRQVIALYPCPGKTVLWTANTPAVVRGLHVIPDGTLMLAVVGSTLYSITQSFVGTAVGTLLTDAGMVSISDNNLTVYIVDGPNRYSYVWQTQTLTVLTDGAFNGADFVDCMDNFLFYNDPGTQAWGCTNAGSVVSGSLNLGQADSSPDNLVRAISDHQQIFLIGTKTTEVYTDAGLFPFPFQKLPGSLMQHGCAAGNTVARLGESIAWLSSDDRGIATVIQMVGYSPKRISTHAVEQAINGYQTISDAFAYSYETSGHEFYVLTFPTADVTWCFDLATSMWHKRVSRDTQNVWHRDRGNCCAVFNNRIVVGDYQNGIIYQLSNSVYTEAGAPIIRLRRCPHLTTDLKRQFFRNLQLQFQPGVGLATGQGRDPQVMLQWSNDGGFTFNAPRIKSIGAMGAYKNRAIWRRLGWGRDRIYQVTITDPVNAVIVSANLNASAGAN